jgi:hypothetical protein
MVPGVTLDLGFTDAVYRSSWNMGTMFEEQERRKTGNLRIECFLISARLSSAKQTKTILQFYMLISICCILPIGTVVTSVVCVRRVSGSNPNWTLS